MIDGGWVGRQIPGWCGYYLTNEWAVVPSPVNRR